MKTPKTLPAWIDVNALEKLWHRALAEGLERAARMLRPKRPYRRRRKKK